MKEMFCLMLVIAVVMSSSFAQVLDKESKRVVVLPDDVRVMIFASAENKKQYYYLPETIQLSVNKGLPEISLLLYKNDRSQITGGILHVLLTWGLNTKQEKNLQNIITNEIDSLGSLQGAADIALTKDELVFDIQNPITQDLKNASSQIIKVPAASIHKTAASFNLPAGLAQFIHKEIGNSAKAKSINMKGCYQYSVASSGKMIRTATLEDGVMQISLSHWLKALQQYGLVKFVSI